MPGTNSTIYLPDNPAERRRVLRRAVQRDVQCAVPGCDGKRITDDCCYRHSLTGYGEVSVWTLHNDGIIDWLAIDVATRGLRKVRLTWVEKDIAVGIILARGGGVFEVQERIGARVCGSPNSRRMIAARRIAEALNA